MHACDLPTAGTGTRPHRISQYTNHYYRQLGRKKQDIIAFFIRPFANADDPPLESRERRLEAVPGEAPSLTRLGETERIND